MSSKNPLAGQLEELVDKVVLPLEEVGAAIDPVSVAAAVDKLIDPESVSPELKTYASIMQIRSVARKRVAKRHDPVERAAEYVAGNAQEPLFDNLLQPYYPAIRSDDGERRTVYVPRESLNDVDMHRVCERMTKAGESLLEHVRALQAWFIGKAA